MSKLNFRDRITAGAHKRFPAFLIAAILVVFSAAPSFADTQFDTNRFDVTMTVNENATVSVTEVIEINAYTPMHGIYRYIPLSGTSYIEKDGKSEEIRFNMKVSDIWIAEGGVFEAYKENGNAVIKIGDAYETFTGTKTYRIGYTCTLYGDAFDDMDLFYANVIPYGWATGIAESDLVVHMPKEFDSAAVSMYKGQYGVAGDYTDFSVQGKEITASLHNLEQGETATLLVKLPEGYFVGAANNDWAIPAAYAAAIAAAIIVGLLFLAFGRDKPLVQTVEFYPPGKLSPAEMGYVIDGVVDKNDVISMIFHFAEKGWLRIEEREEKAGGLKGLIGKTESNVYLVKNATPAEEKSLETTLYDAKSYEKSLFDGIFSRSDEVRTDDFPEDFYEYYRTASEQLKGQYTAVKENKLFTASSKPARFIGILLAGVPFFACFAGVGAADFESWMLILAVVAYAITAFSCGWLSAIFDRRYAMKKAKRIAGYALSFVLEILVVILAGVVMPDHLLLLLLATVCTAVIMLLSTVMLKRTDASNEQLGKILGFKHFINTAEKDRIEKLSAENPQYFYNVLPYAYVFGLTKVWADKFADIKIEPPTWYNNGAYDGATLFNTWIFVNMFNSTAHAMSNSMIQIPSADSVGHSGGFPGGFGGGFGGGGGFSGGGFGGGGGGGW